MLSRQPHVIILTALIWGLLTVGVAIVLRGTPYKERVLTLVGLGFAMSQALVSWAFMKAKAAEEQQDDEEKSESADISS